MRPRDLDLFSPTTAAKTCLCTSRPWNEPALATSMRVPREATKRGRTGENRPRKISGSAKSTELRQARRFTPAGQLGLDVFRRQMRPAIQTKDRPVKAAFESYVER